MAVDEARKNGCIAEIDKATALWRLFGGLAHGAYDAVLYRDFTVAEGGGARAVDHRCRTEYQSFQGRLPYAAAGRSPPLKRPELSISGPG